MPQQERSKKKVEWILESATRHFELNGFATTTNHIAETAGVSIGTLYEYYPDKQALLGALGERHVQEAEHRTEQLLARWQSNPSGEPDSALDDLVQFVLVTNTPNPRLQRLLASSAKLFPDLLSRAQAMQIRLVTGFAGAWSNELLATEAHARAELLITSLAGAAHAIPPRTATPMQWHEHVRSMAHTFSNLLSFRSANPTCELS